MVALTRLRQLLSYNPDAGTFTWIAVRHKRTDLFGKIAGSATHHGYIWIKIDGVRYAAHRLAWLYMTGSLPLGEIDHRNGITGDNRWGNLRDVSHAENAQNVFAPQRGNKSGFRGVSFDRGRFTAGIVTNGKLTYLGHFATAEMAHEAYLAAKCKQHSHAQRR